MERFFFDELKDYKTVTSIAKETHATVWIQETPSTILNKRFRIIVDRFHDLGPVQTLDAFSVFNVT